jgi:hypothetical protein
MQPNDPVQDHEKLYRAIPDNIDIIKISNGETRISSTAFNDPKREPSTDRAELCGHNPEYTQKIYGNNAGVLSLLACKIRGIPPEIHGTTGNKYLTDVRPDPFPEESPENHAHALIFVHPDKCTPNIFDRIKKALSRIAATEILPQHLREID